MIEVITGTYPLSYGISPPLVEVEKEGVFSFHTPDAHGFDERRRAVAGSPNPLVGPFVFRQARPGQTLAISIEALEPDRAQGWASCSLHPNLRLPRLPQAQPEPYRKDYVEWEIDRAKWTARPLDPSLSGREAAMPAALPPASPPLSLAIPLQPMLGCMGVAPSLDEVRPSIDCGAFGGNLDYNRLRAGTTLYLPVLVPGAYLFVGDGHAVQGAGEITGNGVEVSCAVRLRVRLVDMSIGCPRGEDGEVLFCVGCAEPLDQAFRLATREMETWLEQRFGMDERRAGMWMGQLVDYEIGNLVSHGFSAACTMPKSWLEPGRVG